MDHALQSVPSRGGREGEREGGGVPHGVVGEWVRGVAGQGEGETSNRRNRRWSGTNSGNTNMMTITSGSVIL